MPTKELIKKYQTLLLNGITQDNFVGEDVRYSNEFEAIETMLAEANSMYGNAVVNWQAILELTESILTHKSKDLRVVSWFTWALFKTSSFSGLLAGLSVLKELAISHWATIHPTREKTRIAGIEWLCSRLEKLFQESISTKDQITTFKSLLTELTALDSFFTTQWADKAPLLLPSCRRIEKMIQDSEKDHTAADESNPIAKVISQVKQVANQAISLTSPSATSIIETEKDVSKTLRSIQESSRSLSSWWLNNRATDVKAIRLNRTLLWLTIDTLPEHKNQVTNLRPIPMDKIVNYKERLDQGRYSDLLVDLENSAAKAPFWLDGQYMIWQCLNAMKAELAILEVEVQFALFLQRLPSVIELKFHDNTPFASSDTITWINEHVLPSLAKNSQSPSISLADLSGSATTENEWDTVLQRCLQNLNREGLKNSLKPLLEGLTTANGERERFFWHICMAKLCFASKQYELAKAKLEYLDDQIQSLNILHWEPSLVLEVVLLLYKCYELLPQSQQVREVKDRLHKRLCYLNINSILDEK